MRAVLTALLLAASLSLAGGARLPAAPTAESHDALAAACEVVAVPVVARRAGDPDRAGATLDPAHVESPATQLTAPRPTRSAAVPAPRPLRRPPVASSPQSPRAPPTAS